MSDISARLRNGENRFLKWAYKQQYSGHPVISIPRHPDNIDALLAEAADHIDAQAATIKALVEALNDTLNSPKGSIPDSADCFYNGNIGKFTVALANEVGE